MKSTKRIKPDQWNQFGQLHTRQRKCVERFEKKAGFWLRVVEFDKTLKTDWAIQAKAVKTQSNQGKRITKRTFMLIIRTAKRQVQV